MTDPEIILQESQYIMPTYRRSVVIFEKGRGAYLYDIKGKKYLDCISGIATCPLGHAHPVVTSALTKQAKKLINVTNLFYTQPQVELAKKLVSIAGFDGKVFFSNSGTEAIEAAIKLTRKYAQKKEIIAVENAFHGRTLGALSATHKARFREPFEPLVPGFKHIAYDSPSALVKAITDDTAAFFMEPILGEAGVILPSRGYLKEIREICSQRGILMVVDEIQTGMGRTGTFFAYQHEGIMPDIITLAKGLANGIPIGATIARAEIANAFEPGDHGSTFGGNSLATAVANAVVDFIIEKNLAEYAATAGAMLEEKLHSLKKNTPLIKEIRAKGLMIAIEVNALAKELVAQCLSKGLVINNTSDNTLRLLPPLIIGKRDIKKCITILSNILIGSDNKRGRIKPQPQEAIL
ncbi:MAG: hypothetical protein A2Y62_19225 [Candidatus Fischerbacteria bacterium RBG_13_37_8]|uniref:Acetylornithine aminotransferase n=1 Tax=Candidatus Fischerbacteria bacterium RBG_13_37_8 TaxID=1817863 RepID=A0A1F5VU33_9BACT|nr:MAG: hypothetical protein A2Y62_19225 [Candidatus Fischerbacteria bacterium RBG_13_37_8]